MYDPMKEMKEKYPAWLESHKTQLSNEDYKKYEKQFECIKKICHVYENEPENIQKVVGLMQQMQETGQPPAELLKELSEEMGGMGFGDFNSSNNNNDPNCSIM